MRIHCNNCNRRLTMDIYHISDWKIEVSDEIPGVLDDYSVHRGTFLFTRGELVANGEPSKVLVNPDDVMITIPPWEHGKGCCNVGYEPLHCPGCGQEVAEANLDCWQSKAVDFDMTKCDKVILNEDTF